MRNKKLDKESLNSIINNFKTFYRDKFATKHMRNTAQLTSLKEFNYDHFLDKYKTKFLNNNDDTLSIAKSLIYQQILGQSVNILFEQ
ncbi:hypothetical protein J2Z83_002323 [Virgibacillus natechei]|uniref:Integrase SAM-like N-terminal domain-containing protein n=1 Tax=Virgibacillus natechei TaxID=1216297 RepID=A0ABS4II05_9BACI|nr:hypothetical protein [Virgibacillus natechei]MBP1970205.1 hypothetical protein [Virgibacillus natechei]UZD12844.1 hypothetical protein OLD84_18480 [Virgibacillus natechei]